MTVSVSFCSPTYWPIFLHNAAPDLGTGTGKRRTSLVGAHDLLKTYFPCQLAVRIQATPRRISAALFSLFLGYDLHCRRRVESFGETFETIWYTNR
jgi:hypothetical protein